MADDLKKKKTGMWNLGTRGWVVTIISMFYWLSGSSLMTDGLNTLVPILSETKGWDSTPMMLAATVGGWVSVVAMILFGRLVRKFGARNIILISCVGMVGATLLLGRADSIAMYTIAVIAYYFVAVGASGIGVQVLGAEWFPRKKGMFMGISTIGITLGAMTINIFIMKVVPAGGMALMSYYYSGFIVLILILTLLFVKNTPEEAGCYPDNDPTVPKEKLIRLRELGEEYRKTSEWTIGKLLKCKQTWMITLGWGFLMMCAGGILTQMVPMLMSMGHEMTFGVYLFTTLGPTGILFHPIGGVIDAKWGTKAGSFCAVGLLALGTILLLFGGSSKMVAAVGALFFLGAMSMGSNFTMSITTSVWGRYDFPNAWIIIAITTRVFMSSGIVLIALIANATHNYTVSLIFMLATAALSAIFIGLTNAKCIGRTEAEMSETLLNEAAELENL
ncbi:MAG: MFS transporter [Clostridiales Family XIII bacterium]|nr:MFS transporter [Clostridiales Family XIII bacterium]